MKKITSPIVAQDSQIMPAVTIRIPMPQGAAVPAKPAPQPPVQSTR